MMTDYAIYGWTSLFTKKQRGRDSWASPYGNRKKEFILSVEAKGRTNLDGAWFTMVLEQLLRLPPGQREILMGYESMMHGPRAIAAPTSRAERNLGGSRFLATAG